MAIVKGQNLRLAITPEDKVKTYFAAATSCDINIDAQMEDSTTKDDGNAAGGPVWQKQECTSKSWGANAEMKLVDTAGVSGIVGLDIADMVGNKVTVDVDLVNGEMNRTLVSGKYTGEAVITSWKLSAPNRQDATISVALSGYGKLTKVES